MQELGTATQIWERIPVKPAPRLGTKAIKSEQVSALPGEPLPAEHEDLRPFLQRDGLILHSWAKWNNHEIYGPCYGIDWIKSSGKYNRCYSSIVHSVADIAEFNNAMPTHATPNGIGHIEGQLPDFRFMAAPRLNSKTIPIFVQRLKDHGATVDFDYEFTLEKARKLETKKPADGAEMM